LAERIIQGWTTRISEKTKKGSNLGADETQVDMKKPFLVLDDISPEVRRRVFNFLGTEILSTSRGWLGFVVFFSAGFVLGLAGRPNTINADSILFGVCVGFLFCVSNHVHSFGHLLAGKIAGAPLDGILLTSTRNVNVHLTDQSKYARNARLIRSLGGPFFNILVGLVSLCFWHWGQSQLALFNSYLNLGVGLWTLCPIPSIDGWLIWKMLLRHSGTT
jgi:hypothetical protein